MRYDEHNIFEKQVSPTEHKAMRKGNMDNLLRKAVAQGVTPVCVLMSSKIGLRYDDVPGLAQKFLGVFVNLMSDKGEGECFNDYLGRISKNSLNQLNLSLVSEVEFTDAGVIEISLDLSPELEALSPSVLVH